ncbi:DNA-directed RNA polymerase subunit beta [uncultured Candidatus Pelagibacter sp.]|jgi:DNA-directed RNA polymerase subunit beta|uniref:DNA-directed RNA polymerase subunit beta n=1 Tax=uncultured Candidatus Pelagibacter sp. TaxID=372654 RepID=UPI00231688D0|nr:DNA-directed RNA polymerase subunit beta [uncultured Candidatus Pelagibacter sp.]MDA7587726.1 DNA-directed RNA polymerase subunit beta [Candidatus Pelagibacter sp.]MDB3969803.1 DNA-directed RNA polymerase subunit beta [Candidatus Pelagibacter sp.]MDB4351564.1 DNA-directed RNA polymerase subunit beta [Candidatus Pelagibacter sp.]MDC1077254.1 DNA-directed RNA polymerase subunit beta [Candidatus Pelagibacter sp.]
MQLSFTEKKNIRKSFGKLKESLSIPNLIEVQKNSYKELTEFYSEAELTKGFDRVFKSIFPIEDLNDKATLEYVSYRLDKPKFDVEECITRGLTYSSALKCTLRLVVYEIDQENNTKDILSAKEQEVYMGEVPMMTNSGTFITNGVQRVVVNQMHRSPGVFFDHDKGKTHASGKLLFNARVIPNRGSWLDFEYDVKDFLYFKIDRKKKIFSSTLLMALGFTKAEIADEFYDSEQYTFDAKTEKWKTKFNPENYKAKNFSEEVTDAKTGEVVIKLGDKINFLNAKKLANDGLKDILVTRDSLFGKFLHRDVKVNDEEEGTFSIGTELNDAVIQQVLDANIHSLQISVTNSINKGPYLLTTILNDKNNSKDEAITEIYKMLRPGEPPTIEIATQIFNNLFFSSDRYDLSDVGRVKMNSRLEQECSDKITILRNDDIIAIVHKMLDLRDGKDEVDDIDHLGNRRVRSVGELVENQARIGVYRMERAIKEKMTTLDVESAMPQDLINAKPLTVSLKDFFASSQLSQFMDQTNPLSEITHKRRVSALGPGGLTRERAGFEVRDVHPTHYGRICPIETPEGPNIGLINSLSTYAKINKYGFIESPYKKVKDGVVQNNVEYLSAMEETKFTIAQANTKLDKNGKITEELVSCRQNLNFLLAKPDTIDYIDVSPKQLVSVAASLIPFLENDDANRALMGSNMMRQAVPLLKPESPLVGTGIESDVALDSGVTIVAKRDGTVDKIDGKRIVIKATEETDFSKSGVDIYNLQKFKRSNQNTCINQKPLVRVGDKVRSGDIIADGPSTKLGELALGKNVTVAFMPWQGYNFEDSILISERCVTDDVFTSVHIVEYEIMARDTKLGEEDITRDIPNVNEEALKNLDESGVVYIGAEVNAGDILVGKVTPKGDSASGPEEKLLRSIFGEKAIDVTDTSLRMSRGSSGTVVDVRVFNRHGIEKDERSITIERAEIEEVQQDKIVEEEILERSIKQRASQFLSGSSLTKKVKDLAEGTKLDFETIDNLSINDVFKITVGNVNDEATLAQLKDQYNKAKQDITERFEDKVLKIRSGDDLLPSVMKMVKVFVAIKRRLRPGDKMSGRHGNKGVVSKIVPVEDMPYREDGRPVDIVLNPLGVPSRMNVGQILETHLGWACKEFGEEVKRLVNENNKKIEKTEKISKFLKSVYGEEIFDDKVEKLSKPEFKDLVETLQDGIAISTPVFDGAKEKNVTEMLELAKLPGSGQTFLWDGRTGEKFDRPVTVGIIYMLKLHHLVEDKIHARSTGPYSLVTQQPLGGKAQLGGQRFGEMEVWALEAYGASYTLQEILTVKSDDVAGRVKVYETIVKGEENFESGIPESFNVLVKEIKSLALNVELN